MTALQLELSNIDEVYESSESTITSAIKLLQMNQPQQPDRQKRSLLPFLGDAPKLAHQHSHYQRHSQH